MPKDNNSPFPESVGAKGWTAWRLGWVVAGLWTALIAGSIWWNLRQVDYHTREVAITEARANFNKDQAFRFWAASHGGVYVPTDERTPPNPYLSHIPERDLLTSSGQRLTLMNPAYILRQFNEEFVERDGVRGHITSLTPLRPENSPDAWESLALKAFEAGETEVLEFAEIGKAPYLRLMRPMIVQERCLKCHAHQGYKKGDVRGGVAVSIPMEPLREIARGRLGALLAGHGVLWALGLLGIVLDARLRASQIGLRESLRQWAEEEEELNEQLKVEAVDRKRAMETLNACLELLKKSEALSVDDIVEYGLEAATRLSGSEVAYARFLDPDQKTLRFYTWPKGTFAPREAGEKATRYSLDEAGVWVECVSLGRTVVHNDYAALTNKWGLPEGHEPFAREMATPVFESGKAVLALSVGNKEEDYDGFDEDQFAILAENIWAAVRHKRAEEDLRESREIYRIVAEVSPVGIFQMDARGACEYVNKRWSEMVGLSIEEARSEGWRSALHPGDWDRVSKEWVEVVRNEGIFHSEFRFLRSDGSTMWVYGQAKSILSAKGEVQGFVGAITDITEQRDAKEALAARGLELERRNEELLSKNKELDEFTYIASHDLQEPLRQLTSFSGLLQTDLPEAELSERVKKDLMFIREASDRMQKLIKDLLDLSRLGRSSMTRELFPLDQCVDDVLRFLDGRVKESGAEIIRDDLPEIKGDRTLMSMLYQNLIGNALKFKGHGKALVRLTCESVNGETVLGVKDNGIGIDPQYAEQVFAPFKRLHARAQYEGTGIGLAICRKMIERHNGRIWVESEFGKGSHFKFTLGEELEERSYV